MSTKYKFKNINGCYFVSFSVVEWVDVFTRKEYKDLLLLNLKYCQQKKGLEIFSWCIMSNHIHVIVRAKEGYLLQDIIRDYKKYTSKLMIKTIISNQHESRKEWMIQIFAKAGLKNKSKKKLSVLEAR